jgi:tryptophan synthase beta chain
MKLAKEMSKDENIVVTLSGRGDKDVQVVQEYLNNKNRGKKRKHAK